MRELYLRDYLIRLLQLASVPNGGLETSTYALQYTMSRSMAMLRVFRTSLRRPPLVRPINSCKSRSIFTVVQDYEKGLVFRKGRYAGEKQPGIRCYFPIFNEVRRVDMRTRTMQVPSQELITKDNVTIHVDAVAFYRITDALKSLRNVEDLEAAVDKAAQASLRDQLSRVTFDEVLHDREEGAVNILAALCKLTAKWGVLVDAVKLMNIRVDESMIRAMSRVAEAERVRAARVIEASAEYEASVKLVEAGNQFGTGNGMLGLRLREMQTYAQIAEEKNMMVLMPASLDPGVARALTTLASSKQGEQNTVAEGLRSQSTNLGDNDGSKVEGGTRCEEFHGQKEVDSEAKADSIEKSSSRASKL